MGVIKIRIVVNVIATVVGISFIVLAELWKQYTTMLFSIELIVLPSIYVIGNIVAEQILEDCYMAELSQITTKTEELNEKYFNLRILYTKLKVQNGKKEEPV